MIQEHTTYTELINLTKNVRTFASNSPDLFNEKLEKLLLSKSSDELLKNELTVFCYQILKNASFVKAFTEYGILSDRGFISEIILRLKHKILPPNYDEKELNQFIRLLFHKQDDYIWLQKINASNWKLIAQLIDSKQLITHSKQLTHQIYQAIVVLSYRLSSIVINPYITSKFKDTGYTDETFFEFNNQILSFIKKHFNDNTIEIDDSEFEIVLKNLNSAEDLFLQLESKKDEIGTSLHLTFLSIRARQHIDRIRLLLDLFITKGEQDNVLNVTKLLTELVKAEHKKNSLNEFVKANTHLMAYRIICHASEKGEHYIGFSKEENRKLLKSAMGGGLIVVFLVFIKQFIHTLHLSLFFEGFLFGLNYGLGFVLMHLLHFTLATKQPAMTAAFIASGIDKSNKENINPWLMFKQVINSQFISLIGNLIIVLPLCYLTTWALMYFFDLHVLNSEEAKNSLYSNHPFYSGSLIYAAIAGVFLSITGIIIGYVDNKVVYSEIPERIIKHPSLIAIYSLPLRQKIAAFIGKNLGGIIGNLLLGFMLGMAGNIGHFIGIPFDIRHVTISSGYFGLSLGSGYQFGLDLILTVFVGVLLIGTVNIISSFLISFIIACRSRNLSWKESFKLLTKVTT